MKVTYGAGEVIGEDDNGIIYEVVEKNIKTTDIGSAEFKFSAEIDSFKFQAKSGPECDTMERFLVCEFFIYLYP